MKKAIEEEGPTVSLLGQPFNSPDGLMPDMPVRKKRGRPPGSKSYVKKVATLKVISEERPSIPNAV